MSFVPFPTPAPLALGLVATLGNAGYTLVNGTGTVLTWTAPSDGLPHRVLVFAQGEVSVATTGGVIQATFTGPGGSSGGPATILAGTHAAGYIPCSNSVFLIGAGTTFTISQSSAMTAGAEVAYIEIWAV